MGARNVAKAFTYWVYLDDRSFRVLCRMALLSMDDGNPPKYFAGRDDLAEALGKKVPAKPEDGDLSPVAEAARKQRASVHEIVRKAVARLVKEGVIVSSGDARFRNRAEYSLHLTPKGLPQQSVAPASNESLPLQTQQPIAPLTQQNVAPMPQQIVATDPTERCPLGVEEQLQEQIIGIQIGTNPGQAAGSPDGDGASPSETDMDPVPDEPRSKAVLEKQLGEDFNDWYTVYPKHSGRGAAVSAYRKARKSGATTEELLAGARRYSTERNGQDPRYTKMPATWLNQECWTDEPDQAPQGPWSQEYHRPNIPPQYAWANRPDHGDRALANGAALMAAHDARQGTPSVWAQGGQRYLDGSERRLQKGYELLLQTQAEEEAQRPQAVTDGEFEQWYSIYPRREGQADAQRAYNEARKAATAEQILSGAQSYAADPNRDPQYTKLPARWLASAGWNDAPLPPRRTGTSEDRMRANLQILGGWHPQAQVDVFEQKALNQQPELPETQHREDRTA